MRSIPSVFFVVLLAACGGGATRTPPPSLTYQELPIAGTLADAQRAGFLTCYEDTTFMRCRRNGITLSGEGPYNAAVDLNGNDGAGGFDHLVVWSDRSQSALLAAGAALSREGWTTCRNGGEGAGREVVYSKPGVPVLIVVDLSYWSKRRARIFPAASTAAPHCDATKT